MPQLLLPDAIGFSSDRDDALGWFRMVGVRLTPGESVWLKGVRREVVSVTDLPGEAYGVRLLPDFDDPGCAGCAVLRDPPTPEYCRLMCHPRSKA